MERSIIVSHNEEVPAMVTSLTDKLKSLSTISPDCCIYWVPERLRELNEKAYTPRVVSIGPLHHGREGLKAMEEHKLRYLKDFVQRNKVSLEDCVKLLKEREARVRNSYEETIQFKGNEFLEMILVDAVFVIEVMLRFYHLPNLPNAYDCDRIFSKPWLIKEIRFDMLLLENQLPFFILEDLFAMAKITIPPENDVRHSLIRITHYIFKSRAYLGEIEQFLGTLCSSKIEHIVDFVRICHLSHKLPPKKNLKSLCIPSATLLHQAGVTFRVSPVNLYSIRFKNGILEIPPLILWPTTEIIFRNLVAFEYCHFNENYVNDYFFVIDRLIDTPRDVELLVHSGIIESKLPDSQGVASFINNLRPGTILNSKNFYFTDLCEDLNAYCKNPWHKWKQTLKQNYFSTPWSVLSIVAAVVLLALTLIQTVCSVISL